MARFSKTNKAKKAAEKQAAEEALTGVKKEVIPYAIRNYLYGCRPPLNLMENLQDIFNKRHSYYNKLVAIERDRRAEANEAILAHYPDLQKLTEEAATLREERDTLDQEIKDLRARAKAANRKAAVKGDHVVKRERLKELRERAKKATAAAREMRQAYYADPVFRTKLNDIELKANNRLKEERSKSGLHWCTYLDVENAANAFRKSKTPPEFRSYKAVQSSRVAVQIQSTGSFDKALIEQNTQFFFTEGKTPKKVKPGSIQDRNVRFMIAHIRIGSNPDKSPIFVQVPVRLSRIPPAGTVIRWVYLIRENIGLKHAWKLLLSVAIPEEALKTGRHKDACGTVGVDLGWRIVPEGLRVAAWDGLTEDGEVSRGQFLIPRSKLDEFSKPNDLRSRQDLMRDELLPSLHAALERIQLPEFLTEIMPHLLKWKSCRRLSDLYDLWNDKRFEGDEEAYGLLAAFVPRWRSLYTEEANIRLHLQDWRDNHYREWTLFIRNKFQKVVLEDVNWAQLMRRPKTESADSVNQEARWNQRVAAVGRLAEILAERFVGSTIKVLACKTTTTCNKCGTVNEWDQATDLFRTCSSCKELWDQDYNAAINIRRNANNPDLIVPERKKKDAETPKEEEEGSESLAR